MRSLSLALVAILISSTTTAQVDISKYMTGMKVEEDNSPFVPNEFIGSFTMETHSFKNGTESKGSPTNTQYWSSEDMVMMKSDRQSDKGEDMRMMTDLKNKWQYMLMTDDNGKKTAMKSRKQKITMDEKKAGETQVTKTEETKTIEGHTCTKVMVKSQEGVWTGWVAEDVKAPFEDMARNLKQGNEQLRSSMGELTGFPLEFEWVKADGKDKTVTYIRDLQYGKVDPSVFSLDGYEVTEMPAYGH